MADLAELEARVKVLEEIEAIRKLKAKYWRTIDKELWKEREEVYAEDLTLDFGPMGKFEGKGKDYVKRRKAYQSKDHWITAHGGHSAEIEITSETTAKAVWAFQDLLVREHDGKIIGWGHYEDDYVKEDGQWKIRRSKVTYILQEHEPPEIKGFQISQ